MRMSSAAFDGTNSYNNIHSAGLANDNLLSNPGFELAGGGDPDFWANWVEAAGDGALANEAVIVHEGNDAAKMTAGATANTHVYQGFTTVVGKRYRLRFWARGDGTYGGRYSVFDGSAWLIFRVATTTGAAYAMVTAEFVATETTMYVYLMCPATDTGIAYFDACEVRSMDGFLGDEGTLLAWAKVADWEDGENRHIARIEADNDNYIIVRKAAVNNDFQFYYKAGGTSLTQVTSSLSNTDFACYAITWSKSGDSVDYYIAGVASGSADTGLGTWAGDLSNTQGVVIGSQNVTPAVVWSGEIGPVALWNKALTADQIAYLSKV